ncbi:MAG TPA: TfoX/Sxy family protein [bacterium]|nr:TfoX/Sxy family protein [bacterium]
MARGKWKKAPEPLVKAFNEALAAVPGAQARTMFGYPAAFVNGNMFTGVFADRMFVRLPADRLAEALRLGGKPFEPMPGRPMKAYTEIPDQIVSSPARLRAWMLRAYEYTQSLPPKGKTTTKRQVRRK